MTPSAAHLRSEGIRKYRSGEDGCKVQIDPTDQHSSQWRCNRPRGHEPPHAIIAHNGTVLETFDV